MSFLDRVKAKFHDADTNGDGKVSYAEIEALYRSQSLKVKIVTGVAVVVIIGLILKIVF